MSYCDFVKTLPKDNVHRVYHDFHYGFPINNDDELFERFVLEINQAGLSWDTILKKQENFRNAYSHFNIRKVAGYKEKDINRLLGDAGIIRNSLKIHAAIYNAQQILVLQKDFGSFKQWLDFHAGFTKEEWVRLFRTTFHFTGGEIVGEFLMSTGYLGGAHAPDCPVYRKLSKMKKG
ncbi:MAG TPA: DNA-3-methyladenine glycosylase I [Ginsengibacter sp.]|nr:DNA-3-methyladenine glycosylase I [Chitinophagaceae bacterium]HRN73409.1 DNA-3-methyladenine glycosylase I [Ginsengibacter sp.]HRP18787.1 DNA-3-methyladenine glycosylase I [Ginsengibacter sp.]HRP44265.1 DNA-3-methyladenine glycosylase I [Ginsengibacter sp.]